MPSCWFCLSAAAHGWYMGRRSATKQEDEAACRVRYYSGAIPFPLSNQQDKAVADPAGFSICLKRTGSRCRSPPYAGKSLPVRKRLSVDQKLFASIGDP